MNIEKTKNYLINESLMYKDNIFNNRNNILNDINSLYNDIENRFKNNVYFFNRQMNIIASVSDYISRENFVKNMQKNIFNNFLDIEIASINLVSYSTIKSIFGFNSVKGEKLTLEEYINVFSKLEKADEKMIIFYNKKYNKLLDDEYKKTEYLNESIRLLNNNFKKIYKGKEINEF
jgi:hypothetical protein